MESDGLHARDDRAFSKTVSASVRMTAPQSTSSQRLRTSRFHFAERAGVTETSRLSISLSATNARNMGGSCIAVAITLSAVMFMTVLYALIHSVINCEAGRREVQGFRFKRGGAAGSKVQGFKVQTRRGRWFQGSRVQGFNRTCGARSIGLTAWFKGSRGSIALTRWFKGSIAPAVLVQSA